MSYRELAKSQGVERPFEILLRMDPQSRAEIAKVLCLELRQTDPDAQAWEIINRDGRGLQARTHWLQERLSPFARNNNWWEIVTRSARWLRVPFYPGLSEKELERLVFESIAERFVSALHPEELAHLDEHLAQEPFFVDSLEASGFSTNAMRLILCGLAQNGPESAPLFPSVSRGLSGLLTRMREIYAHWHNLFPSRRIFGTNEWRLAIALCALYLQSTVEECLEEFQSLRS